MKELIVFTGKWCEHCQALKPILDAAKYHGVNIQEVDVDEDPRRAQLAKIKNIPTVVLAENENEVRRFSGVVSLNEVLNFWNG